MLSMALFIVLFSNFTGTTGHNNLNKIQKGADFAQNKTGEDKKMENPNKGIDYSKVKLEKIYLAKSCF